MNVLVVGGTGMLAGVSLELARRGGTACVVGRREAGVRRLERRVVHAPGSIRPVITDYRDEDAFVAAVLDAQEVEGPFDAAVVWVHAIAPDAPFTLAEALSSAERTVRYLHVLGSATADPAAPDADRVAGFSALPGIRYEQVVLGFVLEGTRSRWLTNEEISAGVLDALDHPRPRTVVGVVEPWDRRP